MYALPCNTVMLLRLWYVQWAPEDTSTPIKPDSQAASRKAPAASRTLDETDRSLAAAGIQLASSHWESSIIHKIDKNQPPPFPVHFCPHWALPCPLRTSATTFTLSYGHLFWLQPYTDVLNCNGDVDYYSYNTTNKANKNKNLCGRDGRTICGPQCLAVAYIICAA